MADAIPGWNAAFALGSHWTLPAPAVKTSVNASVTSQPGVRGSSATGTRRMLRTRSKSDPPVADIANLG